MILCMGFDQALIRYFYRFDTADYQRTIVRECCVLPFMCTLLAGIVVNVLSWILDNFGKDVVLNIKIYH